MTIDKYVPGDWARIKDAIEPFTPLCNDKFDSIARRGIAVTAVDGDKAMACGGVTFMNDKEGMVWVKVSKECLKRPVMWARTIKEVFALMVTASGVRVYTYILKDFCRGEKLAKLIKMKRTDESVSHNGNIYNKYMVVT